MTILHQRRIYIYVFKITGFFDLKTGVELANLKFRCITIRLLCQINPKIQSRERIIIYARQKLDSIHEYMTEKKII